MVESSWYFLGDMICFDGDNNIDSLIDYIIADLGKMIHNCIIIIIILIS